MYDLFALSCPSGAAHCWEVRVATDVVACLRGHGVLDIHEHDLNIPRMRERAEAVEAAR